MSDIIAYLHQSKALISAEVSRYLQTNQPSFPTDLPWNTDTHERLEPFILAGKMIRGSLVLLSASMFGINPTTPHIQTAAAVEMLESTLLIHDDIMDKDLLRRGNTSIHQQYRQYAEKRGIKEFEHFGYGMGICAGDINFFMVFDILAKVTQTLALDNTLIHYFTHESQKVGFGQMQDFYFGNSDYEPSVEEILQVYYYKTGTYTFALPLGLGAILAGKDEEILSALQQLSRHLVYIFQTRDDALNYFGAEQTTGKSAGSDIINNTKTLFRQYLFAALTPEELPAVTRLFGNPTITHEQIAGVQALLREKGVPTKIHQFLDEQQEQANKIIAELPITDTYKGLLSDLVLYLATREK